jgi:hypothetical protein
VVEVRGFPPFARKKRRMGHPAVPGPQERTAYLHADAVMAVHGENEETIYNFTGWLREAAEIVTLDPLMRAPIRDRNDVIVLCTALSGEADALCSADRDFFEPPASIFLAGHGIDVLADLELMRKLGE